MQCLQASCHLDKDIPYLTLLELGLHLFMVHDFLVEIPTVSKLHHDAKCSRVLIEKGFFVVDDIAISATLTFGTYSIDARILTSLSALIFSFSLSCPILTYKLCLPKHLPILAHILCYHFSALLKKLSCMRHRLKQSLLGFVTNFFVDVEITHACSIVIQHSG